MKAFARFVVPCTCLLLFPGLVPMLAAKEKAPESVLLPVGEKLAADYSTQLHSLKTEIFSALPDLVEEKKVAYVQAHQAERAAESKLKAAQKQLGELGTAKALVGHAKGKWIGGADRGIRQAQDKLKAATTEAEREAARKELEKWQQNREDGLRALQERQTRLERAQAHETEWRAAVSQAKLDREASKQLTQEALARLGLNSWLSRNELDAKLVKAVLLQEATPRRLAAFAQQGDAEYALVESLLADSELMMRMLRADGAKQGHYAQAMHIYSTIQESRRPSDSDLLQRLALAISLEHAVPISQRNPKAQVDGPANVDPLKRYLQYADAFDNDELDPGFKDLSTWELRMVVNGHEPDETLVWGREMLRSYRPDHIHNPDYRWRYVGLVRTDVKYGSQHNKDDQAELQFFQNILMNGGVCGRRAFFGRFILRAFGVPTTKRPSRGHAALAHWTPDGWVVCLGGGWGSGWAGGPYNPDLNFLAITQARESGEAFLQVQRAQWVGDLLGEPRSLGLIGKDPAFWNGVALHQQRALIEAAAALPLAPVGEDLGEANESKNEVARVQVIVTEADQEIRRDEEGVIHIPAVACSTPTRSTRKIQFMDSRLGGKQLHYNRLGKAEAFEYQIDLPEAGRYALRARVATPSWKQQLSLRVNDAEHTQELPLPHTLGLWEETEALEVSLEQGRNLLRFSRDKDVRGLSIQDFTLTPLP